MLATAASGVGGGGLGGLLGQVGDVLSTPRRAIWSALGLPESGSELLSQNLGMDPDSVWTHALGMGAEMLGDPLSYLGAMGGVAGKLGLRGLGKAGAAAGEMGELGGAARSGSGALGSYTTRPMGGFQPPASGMLRPQSLDAVHAGIEVDAAAQAAREGVQGGLAPGLGERAAMGPRARNADDFRSTLNAYQDLRQDMVAGQGNPLEQLQQRVGMVSESLNGEYQRQHGHLVAALGGPERQALRHAAMDRDILTHILPGPGTPQQQMIPGLEWEQAKALARQVREGTGQASVPSPNLFPAMDNLRSGTMPPEKVPGMMAGLGKTGLPIDRARLGQEYLINQRANIQNDLMEALLGAHEVGQPDQNVLADLRRVIGPEMLQRVFSEVRQTPEVFETMPALRQALNPLIEQVMGNIQQRAGL